MLDVPYARLESEFRALLARRVGPR
jgi:hypothetical protein